MMPFSRIVEDLRESKGKQGKASSQGEKALFRWEDVTVIVGEFSAQRCTLEEVPGRLRKAGGSGNWDA
jgi:hypothetical protein